MRGLGVKGQGEDLGLTMACFESILDDGTLRPPFFHASVTKSAPLCVPRVYPAFPDYEDSFQDENTARFEGCRPTVANYREP